MISSTVFPTISDGGFGVRAGVLVRASDVPAVEVAAVEVEVVVEVAAVVVAAGVVAAAGPADKFDHPKPVPIPNPVLGVVVAETAGVEAADVLASKLRLNPPLALDAGAAPAKEKPPEEAGVDAWVDAGVDPKSAPADEAGVEVPKPNPLEAVGVVLAAAADVIDDGKLRVDAEAEEDVAEVLAGSEKEGVEGVDILNKEEDVDGAEEDEVVDPNVELPKREEEEAWGWLGVVVDAPKAELVAGVAEAADVAALEPNENPAKGVEAAAEDTAGVVAGVD